MEAAQLPNSQIDFDCITLGNYVNIKDSPGIRLVSSIQYVEGVFGILTRRNSLDNDGEFFPVNDVLPIMLNDNWLQTFKWTKGNNYNKGYYYRQNFVLYNVDCVYTFINMDIIIRSVHELQNLWKFNTSQFEMDYPDNL